MSYMYRLTPEVSSYTPFHFSFTVHLKKQKHGYLIHIRSAEALKGIVVNRSLHS